MEIDISSKMKQLLDLLMVAQPTKAVPLTTLNPLFASINALMSYINNSENNSLPDAHMKMLVDFFEDLKGLIEKINHEGSGLFQQFRNLLPGSSVKQLEAMIPRINDIHHKIVDEFSKQSLVDQSLNVKRKFVEREDEDYEASSSSYKKVKTDIRPTPIPVESTLKTPYFVRFFCDAEIEDYLPQEERVKYPTPVKNDGKSEILFKREEFAMLPGDAVVRLSKEHACIESYKENDDTIYELKDLSMNGTFLLGNSVEGKHENPPRRLAKKQSYRLKHGDQVGLLMKKDNKQVHSDVLLGFEFLEKPTF